MHTRACFLPFCSFLFFFTCFGMIPVAAFAQDLQDLKAELQGNGQTKITATVIWNLSPPNPADLDTTSSGFFYRLEHTANGQSYFWMNSLKYPQTSVETKLNLPTGTYTVVVYQSRKKKPIKPKNLSSNSNTSSSGVYTVPSPTPGAFPKTDLGGATTGLFSSWNIFTDGFPFDVNDPEHFTTPLNISAPIPSEEIPWVFMTLVKKNWQSPRIITITYPPCLVFGGMIADDAMWDETGAIQNGGTQTTTIYSVSDNVTNRSVTLTKGTVSGGTQDIAHLIFEKNVSWVGEYPKDVPFIVTYQVNPDSGLTEVDTFIYNVSPAPHDPNRLEVDKKTLCECGSNEELTYRIQYQNDGDAPTDTVTVTLMDVTRHLQLGTLMHNGITSNRGMPITQIAGSPDVFLIDYKSVKGLPGLGQSPKVSPHECDDYFYVRLKKQDCLPAGTRIRPKAEIKFKGAKEIIYTNLEETLIVDKMDCESCPPNNRCPKCHKKKPCWLIRWLVKDKNK